MGLIVSTCGTEENGKAKCARFWPSRKGCCFKFMRIMKSRPDIETSLVDEKQLGEFLVQREISVKNNRTGENCEVTQIQYTGWPDHGVPTGTSMEDFESMLNNFINWTINSNPD